MSSMLPPNEAPQPKWDDASARSFYLDQLKLVRAEADKLADETRITERYVLGASGATYVFLVAQSEHLQKTPFLPFILILPPLLALWGAFRSCVLYVRIKQCGAFLREAEDTIKLERWLGWEHWLNEPPRAERLVSTSAIVIWALLILGTALMSFFIYHHGLDVPICKAT